MKRIFLSTLFCLALIVAVDGADKPTIFPGSPTVVIRPCAECNIPSDGLCVQVILGDRAYGMPVERIKGFRFVPDGTAI